MNMYFMVLHHFTEIGGVNFKVIDLVNGLKSEEKIINNIILSYEEFGDDMNINEYIDDLIKNGQIEIGEK